MTRPKNPQLTVPTLSDVAQYSGVSTATVSRCLNTPDLVQEKTRAKVLAAIEKLGYAPNFGARALAAKRTNTIGAVIPTMDNAIFARGLQAFQEVLSESGFTMLVASSSYRPDLEETQIRALIARGADALLLIGFHRSPEIYAFLRRRAVPFLIAWAYRPDTPYPAIGFDNSAAMSALAHRVLDLGHRRIGFISAPIAENDRAFARVEGVRAAMIARSLDPAGLQLIETPYAIENGRSAFATLLENRGDNRVLPSVVMCGNDVLAVGAVQQARRMRLDVPGDVSITGFDDIELASVAEPPLTTVHVPHREMGQSAARWLLSMLDDSAGKEGSGKLETRIEMRGTLAPPR